jgi:hypothetical protein
MRTSTLTPGRSVRVGPAQNDHLIDRADLSAHLGLPVAGERLLDRPVGDVERRPRVARLSDEEVAQVLVVVKVEAREDAGLRGG